MTTQSIIVAYAMTGRTARQIADELDIPVHHVYVACKREGQPVNVQIKKCPVRTEQPWEVRDAHETRIQQLAARYAAVPDDVLDAEPIVEEIP